MDFQILVDLVKLLDKAGLPYPVQIAPAIDGFLGKSNWDYLVLYWDKTLGADEVHNLEKALENWPGWGWSSTEKTTYVDGLRSVYRRLNDHEREDQRVRMEQSE